MRDRLKVLDEILEFARSNDNIRAVVLQGSLANPIDRVDELSDLDPLFYVRDVKELQEDDKWLDQFGEIITRLYDEFISSENIKSYIKMVIYEDGLKVDFGIAPIELIKDINELMFYKVVLDKDGLIVGSKVETEENFYPMNPTQEEYQTVINNFFWNVTYISKSLHREEMYFAKFMFDNINKIVRTILSWHLGIKHNWKVNIGSEGRYLKTLLSEDLWNKVLLTFSGADTLDNWRALFATCDFVREVGQRVARELGYIYPLERDELVVKYLKKIENMKK